MKKLLAVILVLVMAMFMVACDEEYVEEGVTEDAATTEEATTDDEMTITDFIDISYDDMIAQQGDLEAEGFTLVIFEEDNSLIYQFAFVEPLPDVEATKVLIDETLAANASIYQTIYDGLASYVPSATSLIVEYLTVDGDLITYSEFTA